MDFNTTIFIGVDPGAKGYICKLHPTRADAEFISNSFEHPSQIFEAVKVWLGSFYCPMIMIEDVHSIFGASAKSNFSFGRNLGSIETLLACTGQGIDTVTPKVWQQQVGVKPVKPGMKPAARSKAQKLAVADACKRLYPGVNVYGLKGGLMDGKSDALMIAHYCYLRYNQGQT